MRMFAWVAIAILIPFAGSGKGYASEGLRYRNLHPGQIQLRHAFSVKVPSGWRITGGTHRNSPIDARNYVRAESADGRIKVWIDDPNILPRQVPHPAYYRLGWYEGRVVQSPAGPLRIERFQTGAQFAQEYTAKTPRSTRPPLSAFDLPIETRL